MSLLHTRSRPDNVHFGLTVKTGGRGGRTGKPEGREKRAARRWRLKKEEEEERGDKRIRELVPQGKGVEGKRAKKGGAPCGTTPSIQLSRAFGSRRRRRPVLGAAPPDEEGGEEVHTHIGREKPPIHPLLPLSPFISHCALLAKSEHSCQVDHESWGVKVSLGRLREISNGDRR